jgi:hypothetical protein
MQHLDDLKFQKNYTPIFLKNNLQTFFFSVYMESLKQTRLWCELNCIKPVQFELNTTGEGNEAFVLKWITPKGMFILNTSCTASSVCESSSLCWYPCHENQKTSCKPFSLLSEALEFVKSTIFAHTHTKK